MSPDLPPLVALRCPSCHGRRTGWCVACLGDPGRVWLPEALHDALAARALLDGWCESVAEAAADGRALLAARLLGDGRCVYGVAAGVPVADIPTQIRAAVPALDRPARPRTCPPAQPVLPGWPGAGPGDQEGGSPTT